MGWTVQPLRADDETFWSGWQRLADSRTIRHPCLEADFVRAAVRRFGPAGDRLHAARHGDDAFVVLDRAGAGRWTTFRVPVLSIAPVLLQEGDAARRAPLTTLFAALGPLAWTWRLYDVDPHYHPVPGSPADERVCRLTKHTTVSIDTVGNFAAYWGARSKKLRGRISGALRKAQAQGPVTLLCQRDVGAMRDAVATHARLEVSGWKGANGSAMKPEDAYGTFYREVMEAFAARGEARAYQLQVGERLIASQLCTVSGGTLVTMKTAYLDEAASLSPGRLLDHLMMAELFADPRVDRVEFVIQASSSDLAWATSHRELLQLDVLRARPLADVLRLKRRLVRRAAAADAGADTAAVNAP